MPIKNAVKKPISIQEPGVRIQKKKREYNSILIYFFPILASEFCIT